MATRRPALLAEPPSLKIARWFCIAVLAVNAPIACWSGYRAIWQVRALAILAPRAPLRAGAELRVAGESWGRTFVDLTLELRQGAVAETLGVHRMRSNRPAAIDPRPVHETLQVTLSPEILAHFTPGAATLRATALGRSQFLRTPPPTIRVANVLLTPD